jgi:hypothetical protein
MSVPNRDAADKILTFDILHYSLTKKFLFFFISG